MLWLLCILPRKDLKQSRTYLIVWGRINHQSTQQFHIHQLLSYRTLSCLTPIVSIFSFAMLIVHFNLSLLFVSLASRHWAAPAPLILKTLAKYHQSYVKNVLSMVLLRSQLRQKFRAEWDTSKECHGAHLHPIRKEEEILDSYLRVCQDVPDHRTHYGNSGVVHHSFRSTYENFVMARLKFQFERFWNPWVLMPMVLSLSIRLFAQQSKGVFPEM